MKDVEDIRDVQFLCVFFSPLRLCASVPIFSLLPSALCLMPIFSHPRHQFRVYSRRFRNLGHLNPLVVGVRLGDVSRPRIMAGVPRRIMSPAIVAPGQPERTPSSPGCAFVGSLWRVARAGVRAESRLRRSRRWRDAIPPAGRSRGC